MLKQLTGPGMVLQGKSGPPVMDIDPDLSLIHIYTTGTFTFNFTNTFQDPFMLAFFTTVGLGASFSLKMCIRDSIRACYLLASSALYRQATEQVERYTATGMRLLERTRDPVQQAQFQRLRGGLFCLQGAYDKSRYYLLEAMDALRGQPRSTAVRLQLAAVYCDYGRVCRQRLEYADACSYYKRALSLLGDLPWPGGVWVYVHYGRAAFALEDHPRARELFQHGYDNAKVSGELWGRTAASAYTAYYPVSYTHLAEEASR